MRQSAAAPGCSVGCLAVWLPAGLFLLAVEVAGWLGDLRDRVGCGQAEFFGPALDVGPEPVPLVRGLVSAAMSARTIAVMAVLRSRVWPGSQDTSHCCWRPGACRAVWAVWSLVMVVSLMVKAMAVTSGSGSWFGFQVGLGVAVAVLAGVQGVPEVGSGGREVLLDPVAGGDDDHVLGRPAAARRAAGVAVFGLLHAVTGWVGAVPGHWPASRSAVGWRAGVGSLAVAVAEASVAWIR